MLNSRSRCHLYICTFAFPIDAYFGVTFPRTCTLVSVSQWCLCQASSGLQPWLTSTWHGITCVSHCFSCAWFPAGKGMLKVLLRFHGQWLRALVCLVSHECKPRSFSKPDSFIPFIHESAPFQYCSCLKHCGGLRLESGLLAWTTGSDSCFS